MENTAASMAIRIDADVSSAVGGLKRVDKQLNALVPGGQAVTNVLQRVQFGLLQIVQGMARNTFVNIISGFKGMVNSGVKVAETLEAAAVGFETILAPGQNVNALLLDIQENAVKTPFDTDALTLSTQKLALITKNGAQAEHTVLDLGKALAAAGRGTAELNRMATNLQQVGTNALITERDIREFGNAGIDIADIVLRFSDAFKNANQEMTKQSAHDWLKTVSNPYEVLTEALHNAGESVEGFGEIYEKGAQTIKQANENMQDSVGIFSYRVLEQAKVLDRVKNVFSELQNNLFLDKTFTANTVEAIRHVADMINELDIVRPIIEGIKKAVAAFASGQFDNVIVFFRELFNAIRQFSGIQVVSNGLKVLLDLFSDNHTSEEVGRVANQLGTFIRYLLELKFVLSVSSYLANFFGVIMKLGLTLSTIIQPILQAVSGFKLLSASSLKFVLVAAAIVGAVVLIQKYGSKIGEVFQNIGEALANFGSMIGNAVQEFVSFGFNIMAGLWNGLVEGAKAVIEQVKKIARAIINAFKSVFRIASPSKVMRDEVGRYVDEGIAEGITAYYGTVINAAEEVLDALVNLQSEYVKELSDFGALDLVQQVNVYKQFAALYASGTKARLEMDSKVHDAETAIVKEMISLIEDYNKEYDRAYKKAKDYYDMFDYTQAVLTRTTKSVIEGLTRQNDNLTKYYNNLYKMSTMGFDSDFMTYIYEQGLDAASEVAGLADATAEQIEEINNLWATRGKVAADIAVLNTKELKEDTLEELDYLQSGLETKVLNYYDSGYHLGYEFSRGIYDMMPTIQDALNEVSKSASSSGKAASNAIEGAVGDMNEALSGVDAGDFASELGKIEVQAFDTKDALSFLKNMLAGIPWQIWAAGVTLVVAKLVNLWRETRNNMPKAVKNIGKSMGDMVEAINNGADVMIQALEQLDHRIAKVSNAIYGSADSVQNYESAYRQAMNGVTRATDDTTKDVINMIDFAKSQGIIRTQDATQAIGDVMINGFENASEDTVKVFSKIEEGLGVTINNTNHVIQQGLETIDYNARDVYDQIIHDLTHQTDKASTEIEHLLDSGSKTAGALITTNMSKAAKDTEQEFRGTVKNTSKQLKQVSLFFQDEVGAAVSDTMQDIINSTELTTEKVESAFGKASTHTIKHIDNVDKQMTATERTVAHSMSTMTHVSDLTNKASMSASKLGNTLQVLASATSGVAPEVSQGLNAAAEAIQNGSRVMDNEAVRAGTNIFDKLREQIRSGSKGAAKASQESFAKVGEGAAEGASKGIQKAGKAVEVETSKIGDSVAKQTDGIKNKVLGKIVGFVSDLGQTLSSIVSSIIKIITDIIGNIVGYIMDILAKITGGIGKAIRALLKPLSDPQLLIGAATLAAVAASVVLLAAACSEFAKVDWEAMGKAGVALMVVAALTGAIGYFSEFVAFGAAAIAAAGAALAVLGVGLEAFAKCMAEASTAASQIDVGALMTVPAAVLALGAGMGAAGIAGIFGVFGSMVSAGLVGMVMIITEGLVEISKKAGKINTKNFGKIGEAVRALASIDYGNLFGNFFSSLSAGALAGVVDSTVYIVDGIAKISKTLSSLEVTPSALKKQIDKVKEILGTVQEMFNSNWLGAMFQNWSSSQMEGVVNSVDAIMTKVIEIVRKLKRAESINTNSDVKDQIDKVKNIMDVIQSTFNSNAFGAWMQNISAGNMEGVANSITKIMDNVVDIIKNLKRANEELPEGSEGISSYLENIRSIIEKVDQLFDGDWAGTQADKSQSANLADTSEALTKILGNVKDMIDKLKGFEGNADWVAQKVGDVNGIIEKLSTIAFKDANGKERSLNEMKNVSQKSQQLMDFSSHFDTILGTVQSMCNKLREMANEGLNNPDKINEQVESVEKIVWRLAEISFSQGEDALSSVAAKAQSLQEMSSHFDTILGTVQSMCNKLKELKGEGLSVEDVKAKVGEVSQIVQEVAKICDEVNISDKVSEMAEKTGSLKTMAENLNGLIESVSKMVDALNEFSKKYEGTSVKDQVEKVQTQILNPLMGDGEYQGLNIPESTIEQGDIDRLGLVKSAIDKINEIASALKSVEDVSKEILNTEAIITFIKDSMSKLPEAVASYKEDMHSQGVQLAQSFIDGWSSQVGNAQKVAHELQSAIWTEIQNRFPDEYQQGVALAGEVINGLGSRTGEFRQAGANVQGNFWAGLQAKFGDEYWQGYYLAQEVINGINARSNDVWSAGANVTIGFSNGISNEMWRINRAAGEISSTAIETLRKLLRIASPSKVMSEMGGFVAEGFADGIIDNLSEVEEAGEKLAEAVMDGYNDTIEPINLSAFEARGLAATEGATFGGTMSRSTSVVQNNNIYNGMDMAGALNDLAWAVSRS